MTVIIPAYNAADYIHQAVGSALNQTFNDSEVIVVDDGSTDATAEIVQQMVHDHAPRVKLLRQPNGGVSQARNTALQAAQGDFCALLDSDDIWEPTFLSEQLDILRRDPSIDIVTGNGRYLGGPRDGQVVRPYPDVRPQPDLRNIIADEDSVYIMSVFRRTVYERIGPYNVNFRTNEDYNFWLRAALAGCRFFRNSKPLSWYRVREGSLSSDQVRILSGIMTVYRDLRPLLAAGSPEQQALDRQLVRFEAELYLASAKQRVPLRNGRSLTSFCADSIRHRIPPRTALLGGIARTAPKLFQLLGRLQERRHPVS